MREKQATVGQRVAAAILAIKLDLTYRTVMARLEPEMVPAWWEQIARGLLREEETEGEGYVCDICPMRRKVLVGALAIMPKESCGVDDSALVDFTDFDLKVESNRPVLRIKHCPWCGKLVPRDSVRVVDAPGPIPGLTAPADDDTPPDEFPVPEYEPEYEPEDDASDALEGGSPEEEDC